MKKTTLRVYKSPSRLLLMAYFEEEPHDHMKDHENETCAYIFFPLVITEMFLFDGQKLDSHWTHLTKPQIWHLSLGCMSSPSLALFPHRVRKKKFNSVRFLALVVNVPISSLDVRLGWWCVNELHVRHLTDAKKLLNFILHAENYCLTKTWSDVFQSSRLGL